MKHGFYAASVLLLLVLGCQPEKKYTTKSASSGGFTYEYVTNDPLNVRVYTLKNGLKVYLSKYDAEPRIQTQIAVRAGGKNDPATATGLAHYLEHIMFKGSDEFGTMDWDKEKVMLDSITAMFEQYRTLTDSMQRVNYYKLIDQYSNDASKLAIASEYDKMISAIGARGTNAYTTEDRTVYINDIPSNQQENWMTIEASRFRKIVPRLFHTELEAVYEEKNRGLDNDYRKTFETLFSSLFRQHPYGTQTVIGTIDHLKNPSIREIVNYFNTYYRPNNVAICMSGDLEYDATIAMIDKKFGDWKPNEALPTWNPTPAAPLTAPIEKEVYGPDAEWVTFAYPMGGTSSKEYPLLVLSDMILANSQAGLIDLNLKQQQKVLEPYSSVWDMNDYSLHFLTGRPREGQSLEEVKKLLLDQIDLLKKGEFDDWLIEAAINDLKKRGIQESQQNWSRSNSLVMAFTNGIPWERYAGQIEALRTITKEDIVKFANEHYGENYVLVYKRNGKDANARKINKPTITKVTLNKDNKSPFHENLLKNKVEKIKPVFVDYQADISTLKMNKDLEVLYKQNKENDLFTLYYLADVGSNNDPRMNVAIEYLNYLGTDKMSSEEFKKEFYKLGCNFGVSASEDQTYIYLEGLTENMDKAIQLFEKLLEKPAPDAAALKKVIDGISKKREDTKKDKYAIIYDGLINYGLYGPKSPFTNVLTNAQLTSLKPEELIDIITHFTKAPHSILYFGPKTGQELLTSLNTYHILPAELMPLTPARSFELSDNTKPKVFWADYDMVQAEILFLTKESEFDATKVPLIRMFNEYMGAEAFQEIREAQGLAYSVSSFYNLATKKGKHDYYYAYVGTQADKQAESMKAMNNLLQNMPHTEDGFSVAKDALMNRIESERITRTGVLFNYLTARRRGLDHDIRKDTYEQIQTMTLADVEKFQQSYIKGKNFNVVLIGNKNKLDLKDLKKYGEVRELSLDELFGYQKVEKINLEKPH